MRKIRKNYVQLLSILLVLAMVVSMISPAKRADAAAAPTFEVTSKNILIGASYTLQINNKINNAKYTWKTSDEEVAKVSKKGVVTALKKGKATISCTVKTAAKSYTLRCNVNVKKGADQVAITNKISYLLVGASYNLNRMLKPAGSNDIITWSSSDASVISPDKNGKFKAQKSGIATVTATTLSGASDSNTIYVVEEDTVELTKSDVKDGKITISDRSIGNLKISKSVEDASIVLNHVTVGGILTMESGAAYTVTTNECTINKVEAVQSSGISSYAVDDEKETPSLIAGRGSLIVTIDSECNITVKQTNGATIESFSVITKVDGTIEIALEGFKGELVIDSQSQSSIKIAATKCEMTSATIKSATEGQAIAITDTNAGTDQASTIQTVNVAANAAVTVDVKADEVKIGKEVSNAEVVIQQPVSKLANEGSNTSLKINTEVKEVRSTGSETTVSVGNKARVDALTVTGANTSIEAKSGAQITTMTSMADNTKVNAAAGSTIQSVATYGNNSTIAGEGTVKEAIVTGNDSKINTEGTTIKVAVGTNNVTVNGIVVKEADKVAIATPTPTPTSAASSSTKPTATPIPTVTVKPTATPTPQPGTTVPSTPVAPTTPIAPTPTNTPIAPATPTPTNTPTTPATPTPSSMPTTPATPIPTSTPTTPATPTPTDIPVTPVVDNAKKLETYNNMLADVKTAASACAADNSTAKQTAVKTAFEALINQLKAYGDIYSDNSELVMKDNSVHDFADHSKVLLQDDKLFDYAEWGTFLIANGASFGYAIRQYYDSSVKNTATLDMAIAAVNNFICMINRVNTEKALLFHDVSAVFDALEGSQSSFYTAMNQLLTDQGAYHNFTDDKTAYYQEAILAAVKADEYTYNCYTSYRTKGTLTYFQGISSFLYLNDFYAKAYAAVVYPGLIDAIITAMPEYQVYGYYDEEEKITHYSHTEYDESTINKAAVMTALQAAFDAVYLPSVFGEEVEEYTLNPLYVNDFVGNIIYMMSRFEAYEDGSYELLYRYIKYKDTMSEEEKAQTINNGMSRILWNMRGTQEWNIKYAADWKAYTDQIITAASQDGGNADSLYAALTKLYQAKLATVDDGTAKEWMKYEAPFDAEGKVQINKDYCLKVIREKINDTESNIYRYIHSGSAMTGSMMDQAIYEIKDTVTESQLSNLETYVQIRSQIDALIDVLPVVKIHTWTDDFGNEHFSYAEYDPEENKAAMMDIIGKLCTPENVTMILGEEEKDLNIETKYEYEIIKEIIRKLFCYEVYDGGGFEVLNYYRTNRAELSQTLDIQMIRECLAGVICSIKDVKDWDESYLAMYQDLTNNVIAAVKAGDAASMYDALVALYHKKLSVERDKNEWQEYASPVDGDGNSLIDKDYCLSILQAMLSKTSNSYLSKYSLKYDTVPTSAIAADLDLAIYDIKDAVEYSQSYLAEYENLIEAVFTAMPELTLHTYTDVYGEHLDYVEYAGDADLSGVITALQNIFDRVDTSKILEQNTSDYQVNEAYVRDFVDNFAWAMSQYEPDENGYYDDLYYYIRNKSSFGPEERRNTVRNTLESLVWRTFNTQNWCDSFIETYKETVDNIITAVQGKEEALLYTLLVALYDKKIADERVWDKAEWQIKAPTDGTNALIDKEFCLAEIYRKLQAGSGTALDNYYSKGAAATRSDLDSAIYDLKDAVDKSQLSEIGFVSGMHDAFYDTAGAVTGSSIAVTGSALVINNTSLKAYFSSTLSYEILTQDFTADTDFLFYDDMKFELYVDRIAEKVFDSSDYYTESSAPQSGIYLYHQANGAYLDPEIAYHVASEVMWCIIQVNKE